ncbi:MAG: outer membrane protein assembly factor BamD, partial [Pyrinomonadaceae bacterium]|nr:outer membrane protein assembly factor BamD [Pyrinomonadaceae bacterium]
FYLSNNKGKQKIDAKAEGNIAKFAPQRLREEAVAYLSNLVENYPQSQYKNDAEKTLESLKAKK